jgi:hypothetical protein
MASFLSKTKRTSEQNHRRTGKQPRLAFTSCRGSYPSSDQGRPPINTGRDDTSRLYQMRWKTSVPRTLRPANTALPLATIVVGLTKRPDQLVVTLQSEVQFLDVWKTREPRTLPANL